ncbi:hypothetical protein F2Q68_00025231 [Brassica cretica]|uniref:Uncharacterized protein n=1 Tax=Brassica cretica TaxID=69181 RepID=A0A8S9IBC2_BRACR|nr:hypothetical protein F2Q68_00025231 [Brassica cretica]
MLHTAPTVDKKALPSNREEFQFSLISKTRKSTGTRTLPICTLSLLGLSDEHPQFVGKVSFLEWFLQWNPKDSVKKTFHLLLISSTLQMLSNLFISSPQVEGFGCGLSALIHAMLIFCNCTRNVRGAHRSMGLGGCGCLAANSLWVMILTTLHDETDSVGVIDRCSGKLIDRFWLKSVDRCSNLTSIDNNAIRQNSSSILL